MRHPCQFFVVALAGAVLLGSFAGCGKHAQKQQDLRDPQLRPGQAGRDGDGDRQKQQDLPDAQVRQLGTKYRDEWLANNTSDDSAFLARGTIVSVERQLQGWHIDFRTPTEYQDYHLHVYIKPSGEFVRIERGPDKMISPLKKEKRKSHAASAFEESVA